MQRMTAEPRCWGGVSHPLQLTTGLVIKICNNQSHHGRWAYAIYSLVSIRKNVFYLTQNTIFWGYMVFLQVYNEQSEGIMVYDGVCVVVVCTCVCVHLVTGLYSRTHTRGCNHYCFVIFRIFLTFSTFNITRESRLVIYWLMFLASS